MYHIDIIFFTVENFPKKTHLCSRLRIIPVYKKCKKKTISLLTYVSFIFSLNRLTRRRSPTPVYTCVCVWTNNNIHFSCMYATYMYTACTAATKTYNGGILFFYIFIINIFFFSFRVYVITERYIFQYFFSPATKMMEFFLTRVYENSAILNCNIRHSIAFLFFISLSFFLPPSMAFDNRSKIK